MSTEIKDGDIVTLTKGETSVRGPVTGISYAGGGERDIRVGEESYRRTGRVGLWVVTDHQPAPRPEPLRSRFVTGQVNGTAVDGFTDQYGDFYGLEDGFLRAHHVDQMTDVRPLVVIGPGTVDVDALIDDALKSAQAKGYWPDTVVAGHMIRHVLAELGIEAR